MSDPSVEDVVKGAYSQARAYERDFWNHANFNTRKDILNGRLDFKAVSIETANAYQQENTAKLNQIIGNKYDSLPISMRQAITEALIDRGELPNPKIYEGIGQQYKLHNGDVLVECDRCDESFISLEDFTDHKMDDHGDNDENYEESEESYIASMLPELQREKLKEARKLLAETEEPELYRDYFFNGDKFPTPTLEEPNDVTGVKGYNDNPNAGLYDYVKFKQGTSKDRVALEKYAKAIESNDNCPECGIEINDEGSGTGKHDELLSHLVDAHDKNEDDAVKSTESFNYKKYGDGYCDKPVKYSQTGMSDISEVKRTAKEINISSLDGIDFSDDTIEPYAVKSEEAWVAKKKAIEGYDDSENTSEEEDVDQLITERKISGYSPESIKREIMIMYGASESEALDKIYSIEVTTNDKVAFTFFGKKFSECSEAEVDQLKLYSGSDEE